MNLNQYQTLALRTAPVETRNHDLMHAILGLVTEAGELADLLKREHAYGKPIDEVNAREEAGDLLWYLALIARALGTDLETIARTNVEKLQTRYPGKFTTEAALNRDLEAERKTLEAAPDRLAEIRRLMGYVENGTERTVKFIQDDSTKTFFVIVGNRAFEGRSMAQALTKALEANPEDPT